MIGPAGGTTADGPFRTGSGSRPAPANARTPNRIHPSATRVAGFLVEIRCLVMRTSPEKSETGARTRQPDGDLPGALRGRGGGRLNAESRVVSGTPVEPTISS